MRIGIIGTSWITEEFIRCAKLTEKYEIVAAYSRTKERVNEFCDKVDIEHRFTDIEEMAKSNLIDGVYIASPNSFHCEQSMVFMNNGKHVICEKPMASNESEVDRMIEASKKNSVVLMEAMRTNFVPNIEVIRENLYKLGRIRKFFGSYCQYSSKYDSYKSGNLPNAFNPEFSNGSLMDIGVYCLHPFINLFGEPNSVNGSGVMLPSGVDGEGTVILNYNEGFEGVVIYSKISDSHLPSEIQGENGTMIIDKINSLQNIKIIYRDGREEIISKAQDVNNIYVYEAEKFINLIEKKNIYESLQYLKISKEVMKVLDYARSEIGINFPADKNK